MTSRKDTEQVSFRIPREWIARAEALAARLSPPGASWGRTDVLRAAIARGFEAYEADAKRKKKIS